jgi:hypothetical protein
MTYDRRNDPAWRLGRMVGAWLARHRFMVVSTMVHGVVLTLVYYFGSYQVALAHQAEQVSQSVQLTSHTRTAKRVEDMEKILSLLEQSRADHVANDKQDSEEALEFAATSLPKKPEQLLADAKALSKSIDEVAKDLKAEELARVMKISKQAARAQIEAASKPEPVVAPTAAVPAAASASASVASTSAPAASAGSMASASTESPPSQGPTDQAQVAETIKQLEGKAREVLAQREKELERQEQGVSVTSGATAGPNSAAIPQSAASQAGEHAGAGGNQAGNQGGSHGAGAGTGSVGQSGGSGAGRGQSSVRARMANFSNRDIPLAKNVAKNYDLSYQSVGGSGQGALATIPANKSTKGVGRLFGAGGDFADRVYINSWYVIGPFEGKHAAGLYHNDFKYPPEQSVLLDAAYFGKNKELVKWQYVNEASYPLIPPNLQEDAVYYGYTELMMDQDVDLTMAIGADDDVQVWLNDKLVWLGGDINKGWYFEQVYMASNSYRNDFNLAEGTRKVHFKKGRNKVLFKLSNGPERGYFSMVLSK